MIKSFILTISVLLFLIISQCSSVKNLSSPEFIGDTSYYQTWVAGVQGGGSGIDFYIDISNLPESISLLELYFKDNKAPVSIENKKYVVRFKTAKNTDVKDISSSEVKNEHKLPFEFGEEEAILSYKENGKLKYAKIQKIKNKGHIAYPSAGGPKSHN